jgi:hypothetical protein
MGCKGNNSIDKRYNSSGRGPGVHDKADGCRKDKKIYTKWDCFLRM